MRTDLDVLGETAVYPGHPFVLAHLISRSFRSFEEADAPTCHGWPRALGNNAVPGSGDAVYSGLEVLRKLHKGETFDTAFEWARERWHSTLTSNGWLDRVEPGQAQAEKVKPSFEVLWPAPMQRGAVFDEERKYRYRLWRPTGGGSGTVTFVMLNPSTADENKDDPTIRKCVTFARTWGYARLVVVNLFGIRATDPKEVLAIKDRERAIGRDNDAFIDQLAWGGDWRANLVVCAWGKNGGHLGRDHEVLERLRRGKPPHCLKLTNDGKPYHPLYLKGDLKPVPW